MAEKHSVSYAPGIVLSPHWWLTQVITQHPCERLLLSLCIISIRKLRHKEFNLPRFTLLRSIRTRMEPSCLTPEPFLAASPFFVCVKTAPLPDRFSWITCCGELSDLPAAPSPTSLKCFTFRIRPPSNWGISDPY